MVPGPAKIGIAKGETAMFSSISTLSMVFTLDCLDCSISKPIKNINIPPVILKAGILILNNSKIYLPKRTKTATIIKAIKFDRLFISCLVFLLAPCVKDKKTVMLEIGFVIAKNAVNTAIEKVIRLSIKI
ncbi:hypothetical protein GCM10022291_21910 [Postechiella marina]|uniref:Uncharacterized protein n=1 Tax=Postechiella marina TaxID=943941 RepID=A0ABP8CAV3_9FLAO